MSLKSICFDKYGYFPALRIRQAEIKGLSHLDDERKDSIIPLLTLGRWPRSENLETSIDKVALAIGERPYFIDLTNENNSLAKLIEELRDPNDGFLNWRNFVSKYPNAIPVIQFNQSATVRDVVRQAKLCESSIGKLAFRISNYTREIDLVISALSALDDPENAMIFIDAQYIRQSYSASLAAIIATINKLRTEIPNAIISTLATSFPMSTISFTDEGQTNQGTIDILERQLHIDIGGYGIAAYGDYGSIHAVIYDDLPTIMRWSARIDYPQEFDWSFERRPGGKAKTDYASAAQSILLRNPEIINNKKIWGEEKIIGMAKGYPDCPGSAPAPWIAVRVNIHLARQIDFTKRLLNESEVEEDVDFDF